MLLFWLVLHAMLKKTRVASSLFGALWNVRTKIELASGTALIMLNG